MCSINHDLKAIFIHTPKCGGLFIERLLGIFYDFNTYYFTHENHNEFVKKDIGNDKNPFGFLKITEKGVLNYYMSSAKHEELTDMTAEKWKTYKKFAVIRNPYDRFISACKYIHKQHNIESDLVTFIKTCVVNYRQDKFNMLEGFGYFHIFITQYDHLLDIDGNLNIDHYIRFENLNRDLANTLLDIGIERLKHRNVLLDNKRVNNSESRENYVNYYDLELLNFVNDVFKLDFQHFGYKMSSTLDELNNDSIYYYKTDEQFCVENINLLRELDEKNLIMKLHERVKARQFVFCDLEKDDSPLNYISNNNEETKSENTSTENSITLPNGLKIDTRQIQKKIEINTKSINLNVNANQLPPDFHYKNIMKMFQTMPVKYGNNQNNNQIKVHVSKNENSNKSNIKVAVVKNEMTDDKSNNNT